jgi:ankyrin repeat protein
MICCKLGRIDCARLLLAAGASVNTIDSYGNNCSFWAYKYQHEGMIRELGLPTVHTATADEYIQLLLQRNPRFVLPSLKPKAKKKGKDEKGDKKKK